MNEKISLPIVTFGRNSVSNTGKKWNLSRVSKSNAGQLVKGLRTTTLLSCKIEKCQL